MKPPRRAPFAILLLLACAAAGCAYALVSNGRVNQGKADQIEAGIQQIRRLSFKSNVPIVLKTPDEVEQMVIEDLKRDYTDEQLDADGKAGAMLGLYPEGIDLKGETVKLLKSQIAGFYDPHGKQMVLVEGAYKLGFWDRAFEFVMRRDLVNEMLLAHELTHALQDQNFGLQDQLDKLKPNSDAQLALKTVAEGDATIAGFAYIVGRMDASVADTLADHMKDLPQTFAAQSKGTPEGISIPLIFQYSAGVRFVGDAYKRGGWTQVDSLYKDRPQSIQQIMHPELFFEHRTPPVSVTLSGYERILKDWKKVDEDTYGELMLQIILQLGYGKDAPEVALARQWAGDRIAVLKHDSDVGVIGIVALRDSGAAQRAAEVYRAMLDRERASTPHTVEARGNAILVIAGPIANQAATLAPAIWKASKIGPIAPLPSLQSARASSSREISDEPAWLPHPGNRRVGLLSRNFIDEARRAQ
jgi:hypothetical protein